MKKSDLWIQNQILTHMIAKVPQSTLGGFLYVKPGWVSGVKATMSIEAELDFLVSLGFKVYFLHSNAEFWVVLPTPFCN